MAVLGSMKATREILGNKFSATNVADEASRCNSGQGNYQESTLKL